MILNKLLVLAFLLVHFNGQSQSFQNIFGGSPPSSIPDTAYFPFNEDGLQLVIINSHEKWRRVGMYEDAMHPRGGSYFLDYGPGPKDLYLFRNKSGEIVKFFNTPTKPEIKLRSAGYVNRSSMTLIYSDVGEAAQFNNHLPVWDESEKVGLINLKGEVIVPIEFDEIRRFQSWEGKNDKIILQKGDKFGFLDLNMKELFPPIYTLSQGYPEHNILNEKYLKVTKGLKCGLIDLEGNIKIDFKYDEIRQIHDSMFIALIHGDSAVSTKSHTDYWNWGYLNKDCDVFDANFKVITALRGYEYILYWGTNQFIVKKNGHFGVIDHSGEVVIPLEYSSVSSYEGYYHVVKDNLAGLITYDGKSVLPVKFSAIQVYGQAIYVTENGLIGVYNNKFEVIAKPQFTNRYWEMGKYFLVRPDGSKCFVDHSEEFKLDASKKTIYYQTPEGEKVEF